MSTIIHTDHIEQTIAFLRKKAASYAKNAIDAPTEDLRGWYEGRGGEFEHVAEWLELDISLSKVEQEETA